MNTEHNKQSGANPETPLKSSEYRPSIGITINNKKLSDTFSYTNVLVEKNEQDLNLPIACPVVRDYQVDKVIGIARPRYLNGGILCNIDVFEDCAGLYPGICFNTHPQNNMLYLSLGSEPNIDSTIKKL